MSQTGKTWSHKTLSHVGALDMALSYGICCLPEFRGSTHILQQYETLADDEL